MSASLGQVPVRRSPLHTTHAALGATWTGAGWPLAYGDAAGLADAGPLDKYSVRPAHAGGTIGASDLPFTAGRIQAVPSLGRNVEVWGLAPDEVLVLGPSPLALPAIAEASVTDQSSGIAVLTLSGPRSRSILEELTAIDVADRAFADLSVTAAPLANVRALIARHDAAGLRFLIAVDRDLAEYLWGALLSIGGIHGLVPVGAAALAG